MPTTARSQTSGTNDTVLSTELNSMGSSSSTNVLGSAITLSSAGNYEAEVELVCSAASAMTVNTPVYLWFLRALDGTTYEDGGASVTPLRNPDAFFTVRAATSQRIVKRCKLPPGTFKVLIQQQTGQTWASSGNTVKIRPILDQMS